MPLLARLFAPRRRKNREDVAGRAAEVIAKVLRDVGIDRFLNGCLLLDRAFRVRFVSAPLSSPLLAPHALLAQVPVRELPEAMILRAYVEDAALDAVELARHTRFLTDGLVRELLARAPAFEALPARRVDAGLDRQPA